MLYKECVKAIGILVGEPGAALNASLPLQKHFMYEVPATPVPSQDVPLPDRPPAGHAGPWFAALSGLPQLAHFNEVKIVCQK